MVNEDGLTSRENVYAGGDAVTGAATVILAMGAGKTGGGGGRREVLEKKEFPGLFTRRAAKAACLVPLVGNLSD